MKVIGLDGKQYNWKFKEAEVSGENRSAPHLFCRTVLKELFPYDLIFEEIVAPKSDLTFDFVIPLRRLIIECQGAQHYRFTPYFHGNLIGFGKSKDRDSQKREFCKLNNLILVELDARKGFDEFKQHILRAFNS